MQVYIQIFPDVKFFNVFIYFFNKSKVNFMCIFLKDLVPPNVLANLVQMLKHNFFE